MFDRVEFEADTARARRRRPADEVWLYRDPVGWLNARGSAVVTEISGDSIRVAARDEAVDSVRVFGRAFAARRDSTLDRIDQIRGQQMLALFARDSLRWMNVWPTAEAVYFRADDADALEGAVRFSADSLAFRFEGDALRRVQGVRGVQGTYYDARPHPRAAPARRLSLHPGAPPHACRLLADDPLERRRAPPDSR